MLSPGCLQYCDGSSFGGGSLRPVPASKQFNNSLLYFRGRSNFDALVEDLRTNHGMDQAAEIILSGGSAGGLAVFYNLDHLAAVVGPKVMVTGFPDAGMYTRMAQVCRPYLF